MASTPARTGRHLKNLAVFTGLSCIVIGIYHFALGTASVPGATDANATVDSRERFYSAYFAGYGLAWLSAPDDFAFLRSRASRNLRLLSPSDDSAPDFDPAIARSLARPAPSSVIHRRPGGMP